MTMMHIEKLKNEPLAFSSSENAVDSYLAKATSRIPFTTSDKTATLNVEFFNHTNNDTPILLFIHGVCVSCETWGVQNLVSAAKDHNVSVAVLELEGHGLSSGDRVCCFDFDRLLQHVLEFVHHTMTTITDITDSGESSNSNNNCPSYVLSGLSLGGVLATYAADIITKRMKKNESTIPGRFLGLSTICPAVGLDPKKEPSLLIATSLQVLAYIAPTAQPPLTPLEDPTNANCPSDTKRNFQGHQPLGLSKMLLDITTVRVKEDLARDSDDEKKLDLSELPNLLMFTGEADETVPHDSVSGLFETVVPKKKRLEKIPEAGHDLMCHDTFSKIITKDLFQWIHSLV